MTQLCLAPDSSVNCTSQPLIIDDLFTCVDAHNHSNCKFVKYSYDFSFNSGYSILTLNVRSLPSHHLKVESLLHHLGHPDFILLSETWLNNTNAVLYRFSSYSHLYRTRLSKGGGGVSIYLKECHSFEVLYDLDNILNDTAESKFILVKSPVINHDKPSLLGSPPNLPAIPFLESFEQLLSVIGNMNVQFHLCGDFNIDLLSYPNGPRSRDFVNILMTHSTFPLVSLPSRTTKSSQSLIDKHLINDIKLLHGSNTFVINNSLSDHYPLLTIIYNNQHHQPSPTNRYSA